MYKFYVLQDVFVVARKTARIRAIDDSYRKVLSGPAVLVKYYKQQMMTDGFVLFFFLWSLFILCLHGYAGKFVFAFYGRAYG